MGNTNWVKVLSGVLQGISLGPILFLVFINDLDDVVRMIVALKKFADDSKMGQTVRNEEDTGKLRKAIDNLVELATNGAWPVTLPSAR
jgi:ribonuclease P/MRP protein subunit RPP40